MSSLSQAKTIGGLGSLLILLTVVPSVGPLLGIAGFIMVLFAVKYISDALSDASIFNNMVISVVSAIAGLVFGVLFIVATVFAFIGFSMGPNLIPNFGGFSGTIPTGDIIALIVSIFIGLAVVWICIIVSAFFLRKSFNAIGSRLKVGMFSTVALLYLIGAITTIVIVGFLILLVAEILQIIAFFSIPDQVPPS